MAWRGCTRSLQSSKGFATASDWFVLLMRAPFHDRQRHCETAATRNSICHDASDRRNERRHDVVSVNAEFTRDILDKRARARWASND
jgi:hypothetical protein